MSTAAMPRNECIASTSTCAREKAASCAVCHGIETTAAAARRTFKALGAGCIASVLQSTPFGPKPRLVIKGTMRTAHCAGTATGGV